jgi:hypothetical protein
MYWRELLVLVATPLNAKVLALDTSRVEVSVGPENVSVAASAASAARA